MNKEAYYNILSKIEVIEKTDQLLRSLKAVEAEPLHYPTYKSYEKRKWKLTEELLMEMMKARLSYSQFQGLYQKIFSYLYGGEFEIKLPEDLQKGVSRAEILFS